MNFSPTTPELNNSNPGVDLPQSNFPKNNRLKLTGTALAFLISIPHIPCVLALIGLGGAITTGIICSHNQPEIDKQFPFPQLAKVPQPDENSKITIFPENRNQRSKEALLKQYPQFQKIIDYKIAEEKRFAEENDQQPQPIQVVFIKDENNDLIVVACKNGAFCPCSKPAAFNLGQKEENKDNPIFQSLKL